MKRNFLINFIIKFHRYFHIFGKRYGPTLLLSVSWFGFCERRFVWIMSYIIHEIVILHHWMDYWAMSLLWGCAGRCDPFSMISYFKVSPEEGFSIKNASHPFRRVLFHPPYCSFCVWHLFSVSCDWSISEKRSSILLLLLLLCSSYDPIQSRKQELEKKILSCLKLPSWTLSLNKKDFIATSHTHHPKISHPKWRNQLLKYPLHNYIVGILTSSLFNNPENRK